ncbi:phosphoribosylformylglycinamidine synthase-associated small membrane protein [Amorphus orientalis]|uniref:Uncharacterized protein n=1 Tax=Amorphus orientalis TaxID=649198 RepID=A0AAE3VME7_9HYPH|nr:phosphoribosylformylglycinamidine synthase-associated small membrane protein [Amorphus orientalis]MDQ0314738.1 hypothetical protein [Amorphus orientalis]
MDAPDEITPRRGNDDTAAIVRFLAVKAAVFILLPAAIAAIAVILLI